MSASRIGKLILVPAVITLAVTLLRLVGELQGWSPALFNRGDKPFSPSLVGIVWLVPVFGAWFGWKLTRAGSGPGSLGRAFGLTLAALAVMPLAAFLAPKAGIVPEHLWRPNVPVTESLTILSVFVVVFFVGIAIGILAWPALGRTLLAYGLAARIPIALLMLVAMLGNWGTHYDARPSYPQIEHARVVGHARAGAATLVLDVVHDRVRCAVRSRRSGDRAAAGNGSRLDHRTRRARGDVASGHAQCHPRPETRAIIVLGRPARAAGVSKSRLTGRARGLFGNRWSRLGHRIPERTVLHRAVQSRRFARSQHVRCWYVLLLGIDGFS